MRKLIATEYVTLDGTMEDPGGAEKGPSGGWSGPFFNQEAGKFKFDELFAADALLLGRVTYQGFAQAWPSFKDEMGFADRMNGLPKYVVSTTLQKAEWNNSTIIRDHVAEAVNKLKQEPGQDILLAGSASLLGWLMERDLVDEYRLLLHPVIVGGGKRLFPDGVRQSLKLVESRALDTGMVILRYEPDRK